MINNKQYTTKQVRIALFLCILVSVMMCLLQIKGNRYLIYLGLGCFMLLTMWSSIKNIVVPVIMFFLPWSPILRESPHSVSWYTLALIAACIISYVLEGFKLDRRLLSATVLVAVITLFAKVLNGYTVEKSYIMFLILLLFFPVMTKLNSKECDFYTLTLFLAIGMITSAFASQWALNYYNIARFITVNAYWDIVRYSGFYGDPNFYAAQFTVVISGVLVLLTKIGNKRKVVFLALVGILLLYCGFLSASKTFLLVIIAMLIIWLMWIMFMKGKMSVKVAIFFCFFLIVALILSSSLFTDQIDMIFSRVELGTNDISGFTTGRSDLWVMYIKAIFSDVKLLFFGSGYTNVKVEARGSHNTIIQMVYQFGLIGSIFLVSWLAFIYKHYVGVLIKKKPEFLEIMVLLVGSFAMWLSIDQLFFEEFFLVPFYVCMGIVWLSNNNKEPKPELQE